MTLARRLRPARPHRLSRQLAASLAALPLLAGCATVADDAPSLDRRPGEGQAQLYDNGAPPPAPAPASAAQAAAMARWLADAQSGDAAFTALLAPTERLAAAAARAPVGSEAWAAAQQGLSRLATARGVTTTALAEVDAAYLAQLMADDAAGLPQLYALRATLMAMAARQDAALDRMDAMLAR